MPGESGALISEMQERIRLLEEELEVWRDESRRKDTIIMNMTEAYSEYVRWCEASGESAENKRRFGSRLSERGFEPDKGTANASIRRGIALRDDREPPPKRSGLPDYDEMVESVRGGLEAD